MRCWFWHKWYVIASARVVADMTNSTKHHGVLSIQQCDKCERRRALIITMTGRFPVEVEFAQAKLDAGKTNDTR